MLRAALVFYVPQDVLMLRRGTEAFVGGRIDWQQWRSWTRWGNFRWPQSKNCSGVAWRATSYMRPDSLTLLHDRPEAAPLSAQPIGSYELEYSVAVRQCLDVLAADNETLTPEP
jgi:hypothetical protein